MEKAKMVERKENYGMNRPRKKEGSRNEGIKRKCGNGENKL